MDHYDGYTPSKDQMREQYEDHWDEDGRAHPAAPVVYVLIGGAIFWVIVAWIFVARYW